ncbi:hypothetical protein V5799_033971 [Amblyomma americanum]|uniref:Uncharacterized protein n=1 Tax=Amblyomma americanum TaxID=6943 RepID=A0AAQ4DLS7_AMBAM
MCFVRSSHRRLCCTRFVCTISVASGPDACTLSACSHGPSISPTASDYSPAKRSRLKVATVSTTGYGQALNDTARRASWSPWREKKK